MAYLKHLKSY